LLNIKIASQKELTNKMRFVALSKEDRVIKEKINSLTAEETNHFNQIFKSSFDDGPLKKGSRGLSLTVETAQKIINYYPDFNFVSVGRSASWLIEITKLIDKNNRPDKYKQIAFSGSWHQTREGMFRPDLIESQVPEKEMISAYRNYLESHGFTPQKIIESEADHHRKTLLIDFLKTGLKLYSFTTFILDWAEEQNKRVELAQSLRVLDLSNEKISSKEVLFDNLHVGVTQIHSDPFRLDNDNGIWEYLADSSQNKNSVFPIMSFPKTQWLNPPIESAEKKLQKEFIRQKIILFLHEKGYLNLLG